MNGTRAFALRPSGPIQAVTFDVGGTLIEPSPSVGHVYAQVAAGHGLIGLSVENLNERFRAAWGALKDFNYSRAEWARLVDETFRGLTTLPPSRTFFDDLYDRFAQPGAWRVFDDVLPTLDLLASRGLKLGVISNWDERVRPLLQQLRLADFFDVIVVSCEVGFPKPSPVIFQHATEKLALAPETILHVGDSVDTDLHGARAAGFQAVELRRAGAEPGEGQIRSLSDLEITLDALADARVES